MSSNLLSESENRIENPILELSGMQFKSLKNLTEISKIFQFFHDVIRNGGHCEYFLFDNFEVYYSSSKKLQRIFVPNSKLKTGLVQILATTKLIITLTCFAICFVAVGWTITSTITNLIFPYILIGSRTKIYKVCVQLEERLFI